MLSVTAVMRCDGSILRAQAPPFETPATREMPLMGEIEMMAGRHAQRSPILGALGERGTSRPPGAVWRLRRLDETSRDGGVGPRIICCSDTVGQVNA